LSVEGTIEIENLKDAIYVGRRAVGQPNNTVGIFKLDEEDNGAARVQVKLGRSSVNTAERLCPIGGGGGICVALAHPPSNLMRLMHQGRDSSKTPPLFDQILDRDTPGESYPGAVRDGVVPYK
jgi:hypothetical protein